MQLETEEGCSGKVRVRFLDAGFSLSSRISTARDDLASTVRPSAQSRCDGSSHTLTSPPSTATSVGMELSASPTSHAPACEIDVQHNSVGGCSAMGSNLSLQAATVPATDATFTSSSVATAFVGGARSQCARASGVALSVASSDCGAVPSEAGARRGTSAPQLSDIQAREFRDPSPNTGILKILSRKIFTRNTNTRTSQTTACVKRDQSQSATTDSKGRRGGRRWWGISATVSAISAPILKATSHAAQARQSRSKAKAGKPPRHPRSKFGLRPKSRPTPPCSAPPNHTNSKMACAPPLSNSTPSIHPTVFAQPIPPPVQAVPMQAPQESSPVPSTPVPGSRTVDGIFNSIFEGQLRKQHDRIRKCNRSSGLQSASWNADCCAGTYEDLNGTPCLRHSSAPPGESLGVQVRDLNRESLKPATQTDNWCENASFLPSPQPVTGHISSAYPIERRNSGIGMPSPRSNSAEPSLQQGENPGGSNVSPHPSHALPPVVTMRCGATTASGTSPRTPSRIPSPRSSRTSPRRTNSFGDAESLENHREQLERESAEKLALLQHRLTSTLHGMPKHLNARVWEDSQEPTFNFYHSRRQVCSVRLTVCSACHTT
jgi:hypothetical protein